MRTLLFDVDGVLIHGYHTRPEKRRRWDENIEADLAIDPDAFRERFILGPFVSDVLTGRVGLINALEQALPGLGFKGSPFIVARYWLERDSIVNTELLAAIKQIKARQVARLCIATNQEHLRAFHLWSKLGFSEIFDDLFYAARLGVLKPDRRFFERIAALLGPQGQPPLMFDDSADVVAAAKAFGWEAVLYEEVSDLLDHPWVKSA